MRDGVIKEPAIDGEVAPDGLDDPMGFLSRVLDRLLAAVSEQQGLAPLLAGLVPPEDSTDAYELHIAPLGPDGVVAELLKFTAPRHWKAMAIAAEGVEITSGKPVHVALAADRCGRREAVVSIDGQPPEAQEADGIGGRIVDCMLRALGLSTPPPTEPVSLVTRRVSSWEELRQLTANGEFFVRNVPPALAEWMDAGIFSRWCLDEPGAVTSP